MTTTLRPSRPRSALRSNARVVAEHDGAPVGDTADLAVRRWMIASALAVVLAVAVGGITRLTESGLSITEWRPLSGVLPPLTGADWSDAYQRYLAIPEAQTVHYGLTLTEFKGLFWWEWGHRMLARSVGLVLAIPFFVLLLRRQIRPAHRLRLMNLPLLAAMQGVMGWYMVQSGLSGRTSVSPYRLVAHLAIALAIFGITIWTLAELSPVAHKERSHARPVIRLAGTALTVLVFLTILSGGFVAGLDGGQVYNTFPFMEGRIIPAGYNATGGWRNAFENPIAAQFHHRVLAIATALLLVVTWRMACLQSWSRSVVRHLQIAALVVILQVGFGIATVLLHVPVVVAVLHQVTAIAVLASLLTATQRASVQ